MRCKSKALLESSDPGTRDQLHGVLLALPQEAHGSTHSPHPRNVPVPEMSLLQKCPLPLCCALACPAAELSLLCQVLGMSVAGNPAGNLKEAQTSHKTAGGRAHLLAPNSEQAPGTGGHAASAREVWHLQVVTGPITCHPMQPPQSRESQTCCEQLQLPNRKPQGLRTSNCHCSGQTHPC